MKEVTIAGGGLAGLALGIALRNENLPVTILEAGNYPRHRVCGEFISGIGQGELSALGISDVFERAVRPQATAWFDNSRLLFEGILPEPAYGVSRYALDHSLSHRFVQLGGTLMTGQRIGSGLPREGTVWATGRKAIPGRPGHASGWMGIKAHYHGLTRVADLEVHLGDGSYVGVSPVEEGWSNVTGLFREETVAHAGPGEALLERALRAVGLRELATRLEKAQMRSGSLKGVHRLALGWQREFGDGLRIGDAAAIIAPVTGNGMTMALQGALCAKRSLFGWSRGEMCWAETERAVAHAQRTLFARRLRWAGALQQVLMERWSRRLCGMLLRQGWVSFETLYQRVR
jgi:flavin-dependent dehydrogenase